MHIMIIITHNHRMSLVLLVGDPWWVRHMMTTFLCTHNLFRLMVGRTPKFMMAGTLVEVTVVTITTTATLHTNTIHTRHHQFMANIVTAKGTAILDRDLLLQSRQYTESLIVEI